MMNSLDPLFLIPLLVGAVFILAGAITLKYPPKKINGLYGYRTNASMKNQQRWDFAQRFSSKLMLKAGLFLLLSCTLSFVVHFSETTEVFLSLSIVLLACIYIFLRTEKALESNFNATT